MALRAPVEGCGGWGGCAGVSGVADLFGAAEGLEMGWRCVSLGGAGIEVGVEVEDGVGASVGLGSAGVAREMEGLSLSGAVMLDSVGGPDP